MEQLGVWSQCRERRNQRNLNRLPVRAPRCAWNDTLSASLTFRAVGRVVASGWVSWRCVRKGRRSATSPREAARAFDKLRSFTSPRQPLHGHAIAWRSIDRYSRYIRENAAKRRNHRDNSNSCWKVAA
jgi:hypothetical protein